MLVKLTKTIVNIQEEEALEDARALLDGDVDGSTIADDCTAEIDLHDQIWLGLVQDGRAHHARCSAALKRRRLYVQHSFQEFLLAQAAISHYRTDQ